MWQHHDSMMPWAWGMGMWLIWLVVALAVVLVVYVVLGRPDRENETADDGSRETPRDILDRRYAEGELSTEEYEQRKEQLGV